MDWKTNIKHLMGEATQLVRNGQLAEATRAIQQTLGGAVARHGGPPTTPGGAGAASLLRTPASAAAHADADAPAWRRASTPQDVEDAVVVDRGDYSAPRPDAAIPARGAQAEQPGSFTRVAFTYPGAPHNPHHYHLYVPPGAMAETPMPLVLMLHGCTQNPVDFATGTGMNAAAAPANALVLYPEQPHSANPNGCWNWFRPGDQHRGKGEPALLVAMVQDVMARHPVDTRRVYVAGLSAGGAMAALLGREYPEVFAAVGVHSGLQAGAAHNVMAALSAMKNGAKPQARATPVAAPGQPLVPVIVFHGDADGTVNARNGEQVITTALGAMLGGAAAMAKHTEQGQSAGGQSYTRTTYRPAAGDNGGAAAPAAAGAMAEHWVLHGAAHAWAGGHAQGSHTDPHGVNATAEMLRFFLEHHR